MGATCPAASEAFAVDLHVTGMLNFICEINDVLLERL